VIELKPGNAELTTLLADMQKASAEPVTPEISPGICQ
jgi:hypothetical protein